MQETENNEKIMLVPMKKNKLLQIMRQGLLVATVALCFIGGSAWAAPVEDETGGGTSTPTTQGTSSSACTSGDARACLTGSGTKSSEIVKMLKIGINILAGAVGIAAVIMLVMGGIQYSASDGDPQKVSAAKQKISNVIIGLLAFVFLYAFLQWLIPGGILEL